jgi:glycosyltransferase involved in cell wall biosynthesis
LRILIVADDGSRAGRDCSRDPRVLVSGLKDFGHEVTLLVIATSESAMAAAALDRDGSDGVIPASPYEAERGLALLDGRPDVVLSVGTSSPIAAAVLATALGIPFVLCPPAEFFGPASPASAYGRLVCQHLPYSCLVVECDRHGSAAEGLGADPHKIFTVAPGIRVDCYSLAPEARGEGDDDYPSDRLRVLFDASRTPLEEQQLLESVLTRLAIERHQKLFTIVLNAFVEGGGYPTQVSDLWCGRQATKLVTANDQAALARLYGLSDIVVLPSATVDETVPALRAMAAGRPLVAADCMSIRDVVSTARHGVLVRPHCENEWVDKLDYLLGEAAIRLHIGRSARARAESSFSLTHTLRQLNDRLVTVTALWRYGVAASAAGR